MTNEVSRFRRSDGALAATLFDLVRQEPDVEVILGTLAFVAFAVCDTTAREDAARYDELANRFVATFTSVNGPTAREY